MKTKRRTFRTFIISNLLIISLLTLSSCTENSNNNSNISTEASTNSEIITINTDADITSAQSAEPEDSKNTLLPDEIKNCIEKLSDGLVTEGFEYDIDFDGNKELLCPFMGILKIFDKSDNVISEKDSEKDGIHYVKADDLKTLQTYDDGKEKYSYFNYKYENGSMKCNVLTAIKYDSENDKYIVENIVSWGRLEFEGDASEYNRPFFRKGWDAAHKGTEETEEDITQEEFLEIYNKYKNLPAWDEYLN